MEKNLKWIYIHILKRYRSLYLYLYIAIDIYDWITLLRTRNFLNQLYLKKINKNKHTWFKKESIKIAITVPLFQNKLFIIIIIIIIIFGFTMWHVGIFIPWPGIEPLPPAMETQRPHHWTAREFPKTFHFKMILDLQNLER